MVFSISACGAPAEEPKSENEIDAGAVVMKVGDTEITLGEFNLYYRSIPLSLINNFKSYYGDDYATYLIQQYQFDPNASYKDQPCPEYDGSFHDFFAVTTKNYFTEICALCNFAAENGVELTEEDKQECESEIKGILEDASQQSLSLSDYYGDPLGITTEDVVRSLFYKVYLAQKTSDTFTEKADITDEKCLEEYNANPTDYAVIDYLAYTMQVSDDGLTAEQLKTYGDGLAATTTKEEFTSYADNVNTNVIYAGVDDVTPITLQSLLKANISYASELDAYNWLFKEAAVGDCRAFYTDNDTVCTVYMLVTAPHLNDYTTKNARHILVNAKDYTTDDDCKAEAERIYREYLLNPTEENFADLANKYSDDPDLETDENGNTTGYKEVKTSGGLYENIEKGKMVAEFEQWVFAEERQPGDTGIIKTQYGYHVMYFVGDGKEIKTGTEAVRNTLLRKAFEEYRDSFEVTYEAETIDSTL